MKSAIKKVFWFYTILFLILIGYLVKLCLFDSNGFVANSFNPRLTQGLPDVKRGAILDINGKAIAQDEANQYKVDVTCVRAQSNISVISSQ